MPTNDDNPMTAERLRELAETLRADASQVTDEQLAEATEFIRQQRDALADAAPTPDTVAALTELRDARNLIVGQQAERAEAVERAQALRAELADRPADAPDDTGAEPPAGDDGQPDGAGDEQPAAEPAPDQVNAAAPRQAPIGSINRSASPALAVLTATATVTATGNTPAFGLGQRIDSSPELARAMSDRLRSMSSSRGGSGEKVYVARATTEFPTARQLSSKEFDSNYAKIEAATSPVALVAAGGLCAPLETLYDVEVIGSTARPIRDALARFGVDRGGIQYRPNSSAAAAVLPEGVDVWTMDDDTADPLTPKTCFEVECPAVEDAEVEAIYLCLEFANITSRFDPEVTAANLRQGTIAHTRLAENTLLAKLQAGSKLLTGAQQVGATRDILANLDKAVAYYRNRHRIDTGVSLTFILPAWVRTLIRTDLARQMAAGDWPDALGVSDTMIDGWFTRRGVSPAWHLDGSTTDVLGPPAIAAQTYDDAEAGAAIPAYPAQIDSLLFVAGSWLFLDGGTLDLGVVRDSDLNSRNRYRQFSETFEGVADRGIESLRLVMSVEPNGSAVGTVDPATITS